RLNWFDHMFPLRLSFEPPSSGFRLIHVSGKMWSASPHGGQF
ncbi:MAG: hypothetical protein ACI9KS_002328, partial [Sulfitobacter sp.]